MSELKPCPLCGAPMQFRKALWPYDGDTDAVIHNVEGGTNCGLSDFSIGATDEVSTIAAWNTRPVEQELVEALESARACLIVERQPNDRIAGIGYASDALPKLLNILDTAIAKARGETP